MDLQARIDLLIKQIETEVIEKIKLTDNVTDLTVLVEDLRKQADEQEARMQGMEQAYRSVIRTMCILVQDGSAR